MCIASDRYVRSSLVLPAVLAAGLVAQRAQGGIITFDDLGPSTGGTLMRAEYA